MPVDDMLKLARKGKLEELESAWMAAIAAPDANPRDLLDVPRALADRDKTDAAESLLWYWIDMLQEQGKVRAALDVARAGGGMLPGSEMLRDQLADLYEAAQDGGHAVRGLVKSILRQGQMPLDHAVACIDCVLALHPGQYVLDPHDGSVGRVGEVDPAAGTLTVDFGEGQKAYAPGLTDRLKPVETDDFRALCVFERERLEKLATEDPEELVRLLLTALDPRMPLRRIRLYLEPLVGSWSRWWSRAKGVLRRSAEIGMTEGSKPSLFLRSKPLTHGERLLRKVRSASSPVDKLEAALLVLAEMGRAGGEGDADALQAVADEVTAVARQNEGVSPPLVLAARAVIDELVERFPDVETPSDLAEPPVAQALEDPEAVPAAIAHDRVALYALKCVRARAPQAWPDFYAAVMPVCRRQACDEVARSLREAGAHDGLTAACQEILGRSDANPGALAWLWREVAGGRADDLGEVDPAAVVLDILSTLGAIVRASGLDEDVRKQQIAELRTSLFLRNGEPLRRAVEGATRVQVAALKAQSDNHPALTSHMLADMVRILRRVRPELFERKVHPWEEETVYATAEGIEKRRAELEHLTHVRLPEVIREIGQAASFGDLSENAEYSAAIQERARLAERAAQMQQEIAGARLITPEIAGANHVTVGSRVTARSLDTQDVESMAFLGPWDARPEDGVYAYNAPLGLAFMGKRAGDMVTLQLEASERRWEILEITPAVV